MTPFPPATLIRLYEFLKNSRLIEQFRPTTKQPRSSDPSRFGVDEGDGGG
ncbi:hypothetical protein [Xenophilus azovorans]|nr:hypothetical protein [Xenophilus azovorans]